MSGKVAQPAVPKKRNRSKVTVQNVRSGMRATRQDSEEHDWG